MTLVKVGVYCLRGGGHWACYDDAEAMACDSKGPDVYIDVDFEDMHMYPEWLADLAREAIADLRRPKRFRFVHINTGGVIAEYDTLEEAIDAYPERPLLWRLVDTEQLS